MFHMFTRLIREHGVIKCKRMCPCYYDILNLSLRLPVSDDEYDELKKVIEKKAKRQQYCRENPNRVKRISNPW